MLFSRMLTVSLYFRWSSARRNTGLSDSEASVSGFKMARGRKSAFPSRSCLTLIGAPVQVGIGSLAPPAHMKALSPLSDSRATAGYRRDAALLLVQRALDACAGSA